ncbi:hypothetical protein F4861DRAFT_159765 [Xylaria intraflava]|nr:hypothetical protein F4861DRAFT_159765 [Xylaria intraflava]
MDDESDSPPPRPQPTRNLPSRRAKIKPPARETRATAAYFTSSSTQISSTETDSHSVYSAGPNLRPRRTRRKPPAFPVSSIPAKSAKRRRIQPPVRQLPLAHDKPHATSHTASGDISFQNPLVSVPWQTLPYHVWLGVFDFVAAPIRDPASRIDDVSTAVYTLLSGARSCKATAEPALAALYKCPPFHQPCFKHPQGSFAQFLRTLALPPSESFIRYRPKVQILRIDVDGVLSKKLAGAQVRLSQLLKYLPRLACLELYHPADEPPYRDLGTHWRWKLSKDDLLEAFGSLPDGDPSVGDKTTSTALQSWRWNSRFVSDDLTLDHLTEIHALPSFCSLRKLAYVNYQLPSITRFTSRASQSQEALDSDLQAIAQLAASISVLPNLEHLVIESSTLATGALLERLPKTLTHLELLNCWEITSEDMANFLLSHGNSLTHLTLKHCQSLSLGFLPVLGMSCPNLAHLEVDMTYFRHHASYADNKPDYATLLEVDQVPTWPSSIQSIEIVPMRNWTREAADMFFGSLMKNAKSLPNLRRLEFKVILNIDWRQRQEMRQSLADQMTKVFKRKSSPPMELKCLRRYNELKSQDVGRDEPLTSRARKRSFRIADQSSTLASNKDDELLLRKRNFGKAIPVRRSLRSLKSSSRFDADDEDSSEDELSVADISNGRPNGRSATAGAVGLEYDDLIQGLCDVVDIQVDNQRPAERQYDMDDFINSSEQSDPEWNSDDDSGEDEVLD